MVITKREGELEYLAAEGISVPHCFTTRFGGVSSGHLSSLNIGTGRGDDPANVLENYRRLGKALGFAPEKAVLSRQTHSDIVRPVGAEQWGAGLFAPSLPECDGLITNVPGSALVVFTADCTPILVWDEKTGAVGAAHAGWRGTVQSIAARMVEAMTREYGCDPASMHAAVGPNIGVCHFETHDDVPDAVHRAFGNRMDAYIFRNGEKYRLDLKAINAAVLREAGVGQVEVSDACTVCRSDRFWSHRVTQGKRGSQGAVIVCQEARR